MACASHRPARRAGVTESVDVPALEVGGPMVIQIGPCGLNPRHRHLLFPLWLVVGQTLAVGPA